MFWLTKDEPDEIVRYKYVRIYKIPPPAPRPHPSAAGGSKRNSNKPSRSNAHAAENRLRKLGIFGKV